MRLAIGVCLALLAAGCGGDAERNAATATTADEAAKPAQREIPQPPSNLTFAYGFADTSCGSQGLEYEHYGVSQEVFVCIGSELPELKGKAQCFVGQPSPDTTGTNMLGQYDVAARTVVPGGNSIWPQPCRTTFASMLQWYYHKERGTLEASAPQTSTNPAPAEAPQGASGVLQVKRSGELTCYSTSEKYTFPNGESALIGICEGADGRQTCASYQQSSGRVVTIGFPDSPWQPECQRAQRLVEEYKSGGGERGGTTAQPPAAAPGGKDEAIIRAKLTETCAECAVESIHLSTIDREYASACATSEGYRYVYFYVRGGGMEPWLHAGTVWDEGRDLDPRAVPKRVEDELAKNCGVSPPPR